MVSCVVITTLLDCLEHKIGIDLPVPLTLKNSAKTKKLCKNLKTMQKPIHVSF